MSLMLRSLRRTPRPLALMRGVRYASTMSFSCVRPFTHVQSTARRAMAPLPAHVLARAYASGTTFEVPPMGDSISEGEVGAWHVAVGDTVSEDTLVCEIETDKITVDIRAPSDLEVTELCAQEGDAVAVGGALFKYKEAAAGAAKKEEPKAEQPKSEQPKAETKADAPKPPQPPQPPSAQSSSAPKPEQPKKQESESTSSSSSSVGERVERRVPMKKIRQRIAQRLKDSQNTAAMLTTFQEVDLHALMQMRARHKEAFQKRHDGLKLGFMSAFVKASAIALQEIPVVNAVIDDATNEIVYRDFVDISVAVSSPTGLVVPVIRQCHLLTFADIEREISHLAQKARDNKLSMEEMTGGMHAIKDRAMVVDGEIKIRPVMYLALTYDHRLIDGREAATTLVRIKQLIEDPASFLLA